MNEERLNELADLLDTVDEIHILRGEPTYDHSSYRHPCGTPACALGHWAAAHPERWTFDDRIPLLWEEFREDDSGVYDDESIEFGISDKQSLELFGSFGCGNAQNGKEAAAYIREFIKRNRKEPT